MKRQPKICPTCGVDKRFRKLFNQRVESLEAELAEAKAEADRYKRMWQNKSRLAKSLHTRLYKEMKP